MLNHGVSSAMMFLLVGIVYERAHHRNLDNFGGMALQMPYYTGFATIGFFASLGLPGLNGFISEFLSSRARSTSPRRGFWAAYVDRAATVCRAGSCTPRFPAIVLTAGYILWTIQRVYLGEVKQEKYKSFPDLNLRETLTLIPLAGLCIILGVYPRILTDFMDGSLDSMTDMVRAALRN